MTIFTPTLDRAEHLRMLYESLATQPCMDFEWIVVDGGSTDFTPSLMRQLMAQGRIEIKYLNASTPGECAALAEAARTASGELMFCVRPGQFLPDEAVEQLRAEWKRSGHPDHGGLIGLDLNLSTMEPSGRRVAVIRTDLLRRVAPPERFEGEREPDMSVMEMVAADGHPLVSTEIAVTVTEDRTDGFETRPSAWKRFKASPRTATAEMRMKKGLKDNPVFKTLWYSVCCALMSVYVRTATRRR
ncbi:MAG: glycosyltransferase [Duncaniella sp.]|nr:glycosyltransferase [Duncaniella sp.]